MRTLLPLLLLVACSADPPSALLDPDLVAHLDEAVVSGRAAADAPAAVASVYVPGVGAWVGTAGWEDDENRVPAGPWGRYRIGSITKTFVASLILQLDGEGVLDLDDLVATWLPDAPYADRITIRMLLSHTSGLDDFVDRLDFLGQTDRAWTPEELIALIADEPLLFEPGTEYQYSNAGYILLGMLVQEATGTPWTAQVRERFLDPYLLRDTSTPSAEPGTDTDVVGYLGGQPVTDVYNPNGSWAAGEMVADANDLTWWAAQLYGGNVLEPAQLAEMTTGYEFPGGGRSNYGLGCQIRRYQGRDTVGHSGSTIGFQARLRYDVASGVVTSVVVNDFTADSDEVEKAIWRVLIGEEVFALVP